MSRIADKTSPKRRTLNREAVVRRAVEMVNASRNLESLSMAELAVSLGVKPPSLYNHIAGQDDLILSMRRYAWQHLAQTLRQSIAGQSGRKAILFAAHGFRQFAHDHPGIYPMLLHSTEDENGPDIQAASSEILNTLVLIFASAGLTGTDALHAIRGLRSILHGFVLLEVSGGFGMDLELETSFNRVVTAYVDGILAAGSAGTSQDDS